MIAELMHITLLAIWDITFSYPGVNQDRCGKPMVSHFINNLQMVGSPPLCKRLQEGKRVYKPTNIICLNHIDIH